MYVLSFEVRSTLIVYYFSTDTPGAHPLAQSLQPIKDLISTARFAHLSLSNQGEKEQEWADWT